MAGKTLKDIEKYLSVLGLDTTVVPTMTKYREAYKEHFHKHPDKNLDKDNEETTEEFQKITEAGHEILEFLTAKGNKPASNQSTDSDILTGFVKTNKMEYKSKCITFYLTKDTVEAWKKEFEMILGSPKPLPTSKTNKEQGIQYKQDTWCVASYLIRCSVRSV